MNKDIEAIEELVQEILKAIKVLNEKQNGLCIKLGRIVSGSNGIYQVDINQERYTIKSQLQFNTNDVVGVLTSYNMTGLKYILG